MGRLEKIMSLNFEGSLSPFSFPPPPPSPAQINMPLFWTRPLSQGHARHGRTGRRAAGAGRQRQQLEPTLDRTVRPANQPVDNVDADADAPQLGGRRAPVLLQHGRQADVVGRRIDRATGGRPARRRRPVRRHPVGRRVRQPFAVQVHRRLCRHVRMIETAVVHLRRKWRRLPAIEHRRRTVSFVTKLERRLRVFRFFQAKPLLTLAHIRWQRRVLRGPKNLS